MNNWQTNLLYLIHLSNKYLLRSRDIHDVTRSKTRCSDLVRTKFTGVFRSVPRSGVSECTILHSKNWSEFHSMLNFLVVGSLKNLEDRNFFKNLLIFEKNQKFLKVPFLKKNSVPELFYKLLIILHEHSM